MISEYRTDSRFRKYLTKLSHSFHHFEVKHSSGTFLTCQVQGCHYKSPSQKYLQRHIKVHDITNRIKCEYENCSFKAIVQAKVDFHVREVHLKIKFNCQFCEYSNSRKFRLAEHIKKLHPNTN